MIYRKEPVCLKCSEELVNVNSRREPVCLKCSEGLVIVNSRSGPVCLIYAVEGSSL